MLIDKELIFSDAQAILDDGQSTNVLAVGDESDLGNGEPIYLLIVVNTAYSGGTGTQVEITLRSSNVEAMTSPTVVLSTGVILTAALTAGAELFAGAVPRGTDGFLDLDFAFDNAYGAGAVSAYLVKDLQAWRALAGNNG